MKTIHSKANISVPNDVTVTIKSRVVSVKGPRGELTKNFRHMDVDIKYNEKKGEITVEKWFAKKKEIATIKTACSLIENMFTGLQRGFKYKMKLVYAHFPVNVGIKDDGSHISIMNFIGQKVKFEVEALPGVRMHKDQKVPSEFFVEGNDLENVSRTCALISQSCQVRNKDIRKFLDGIYVQEKGHIVDLEEE
eukprot:TRINITY_DN135_c0_g1_i3.p2 TRINITY_DN135_c0_g1~~TRINITY_DN135_c0_g1_i3.p2  ORF type:complete len:193 (+),score=65.65 TRINITY_DN135_c0_g1_i3:222-800(+)